MLSQMGDYCFGNIGKYEKKLGLEADDKEVYIIDEAIDKDEWISLEDFVLNNGGLLNIPLFYKSEAPLFIIWYWALHLLSILQLLQEKGFVIWTLQLNQIFISRDGKWLRFAHFRGIGKVNNFGNMVLAPDVYLSLSSKSETLIER